METILSRILIFATFLIAAPVFMQDALPQEQEWENMKKAYGIVRKISGEKMAVSVYHPDKKELSEETFQLTPDTELVIVRPVSELIEGDEVKITYQEEEGKKVSRFVSIMDLPGPSPQETEKAE